MSQQLLRPAPIPSPLRKLVPPGAPLESLPFVAFTYSVVYRPGCVDAFIPFIKDFTGGSVQLDGPPQFNMVRTHQKPWMASANAPDPIFALLQRVYNWLNAPSLSQQARALLRPKIVPQEDLNNSNGWVPLRYEAPVYVGLKHMGLCRALYAAGDRLRLNGSETRDIALLVVQKLQVFATGDEPEIRQEYKGAYWSVPISFCLPLKWAISSWPSPNRSTEGVGADEALLLRDDGTLEPVPVNYVMMSDDRRIVLARAAFRADYPESAFGLMSAPIVPPTGERAKELAKYTIVRYGMADEQQQQQQEAPPTAEEEQATPAAAVPSTTPGAAPLRYW